MVQGRIHVQSISVYGEPQIKNTDIISQFIFQQVIVDIGGTPH